MDVKTRYIDGICEAARIYFESKNISSFDIGEFLAVLKYVVQSGVITSEQAREDLRNIYPRDIDGYLSLAWHLGLLSTVRRGGVFEYRPTKNARIILAACENQRSEDCKAALRMVFRNWAPLKTFLKFAVERGFHSGIYSEAVRILGEEMRRWNEILMRLGLPVNADAKGRPPAKPFNDYVMRRLFRRIVEFLGPFDIAPGDKGYSIVKSRSGEPITAACIAHVIALREEAVLISPFIDDYGVELITRAHELSGGKAYITLITRKSDREMRQVGELKKRLGDAIEVYTVERHRLHAKVYASNEEALLTSANLLKTSLLENVEVGVFVKGVEYEIRGLIEDLITNAISQR